MPYPAGSDLGTFLAAAGLTLTSGQTAQLNNFTAAAVADFERVTGRRFLAVSATRQRDPPVNWRDGAAVLRLEADLASCSGIVYTPTGTTAETLVAGTDYDLGPEQAPEKGWPWREVRFFRRWAAPLSSPYRRSLYITGAWGYSVDVPADVYLAMLSRAAWLGAPPLILGLTGGLKSWTEADVTANYGDNPLAALMSGWGGADGTGGIYGDAVRHYRLV